MVEQRKRAQSGMDRSLSVVSRPVADLRLDPNNPRLHARNQIRQIARSIETFGFNVPVLVDAQGQLIAGHGRVLAAQLLGMTHVPTIRLEHLTEAQTRAFMIADNRLTENSVWDDRLLAEQLKALAVLELDFSVDVTGFLLQRIAFAGSEKEICLDAVLLGVQVIVAAVGGVQRFVRPAFDVASGELPHAC